LALTAELANRHVRRWLDEVANGRVHGSTGAVPVVDLDIKVHSAHVATDAPRSLAQGDRAGACQRLHQRHTAGSEHLPEQDERLDSRAV
jgi:hypothetical protein